MADRGDRDLLYEVSDLKPRFSDVRCACGCGLQTRLAPYTRPNRGWIKGQPLPFVGGHNFRVGRGEPGRYLKAEHRPGGRTIGAHVAVAERALGHSLPHGAEVHHVDGDPHNNANRNLVICQNAKYHKLLHHRTRVVRCGGNPDTEKVCTRCQLPKPLADFNLNHANKLSGRDCYCRQCKQALDLARKVAS